MEIIYIDQPNGWEDMELHEYCTIFPPMEDADYDALVKSMQEIGFMETDPIVLVEVVHIMEAPGEGEEQDVEYQILDGRNRRNAAIDAGVEPQFALFEVDEEEFLPFVMARNMDRRHLTTGQKAAIASKLANLSFGSNQHTDGVTQKEAADKMQVGEASVRRFNFVKDRDPELAEKVATGEVPLQEAREEVADPKLGDKRKERTKLANLQREFKIGDEFNKLVIEYKLDEDLEEICRHFFLAGVDFIP